LGFWILREMCFKKTGQILIIALFFVFTWISFVRAGFGISPPYVINNKLMPGSHYEQRIGLSRSDPDEDLQTTVTIDAPEIESWISIDPGKEFIFPKGEKLIYMTVKVDVPETAALKNYKGYVRVKVAPVEAIERGLVAVALGARIDVDLTVGRGEIFDFLVRLVDILDVEKKSWPLVYFTKIRVLMKIENKGNIESSPTRAHLDVYDIHERNLLESSDDTELEKIKPFKIKEIFAEFPTKLEPDTYWGEVKVFNGEEVFWEDKLLLTIKKIPFSTKDWMILGGSGIGLLIILTGTGYGGYRIWQKKKKK